MRKFNIVIFIIVLLSGGIVGRTEAAKKSATFAEKQIALRNAIKDLIITFDKQYPNGEKYLSQFNNIRLRMDKPGLEDTKKLETEFADLQLKALIANPLVSCQPILFIVRKQYKKDHHNTATIFKTGEINTSSFEGGGAMKIIDLAKGGHTRTLIETDEGLIRDPEVHFNGKKIIFSMRRNITDDYHIYEINTDGTGIRQLTSAPGVADFDPLYTTDDDIIFSSTREPKYCMCNRHIMGNLFKMDADGANIHQIGKSTLHEGHSSLLPDGRILYDRWEYVDRNFGDAQGLWTVNPDGTNHAVYWGNNTNSPGGIIDARSIPGTQQVLCIFGSCHDRPWGALAIIDRQLGTDGRDPVIRTWPADAVERVGKGDFDAFLSVKPKYEDPYPLSDKYFLCSRMTGRGEQMGIYLVDVFGNEILLHVEGPGCYDPMPLRPRPRPLQIPSRRDFDNGHGYFYIINVYEGTHMKGVEPGTIKYLRVVESPEKRFWTYSQWGGQGVHCPAMNWHSFENKRILGTVPVAEDGSVYFEVPADKFVYFQLLDENKMMVQSMRSGTIIQSGETTGCVGCHDNRRGAPALISGKVPAAFKHHPSKLEGWHGKPRIFSYYQEVQPVFDKHCVSCHDYNKEAGTILNLAVDRTNTFNTSYNELWRKKYINAIGAGPYETQPAYSWGSHTSKIVKVIREGHYDIQLSKNEFETIVTWIDLNGVYYPRYDTAYPDNLTGRSPLNNEQIERLSELTGIAFVKFAAHNNNCGPQVSFDRPELSPCLAKFEDKNCPEYIEALGIICAGTRMLEERPRADMPGFEACTIDQKRQETYVKRQEIELRNRQAIQKGQKIYDSN